MQDKGSVRQKDNAVKSRGLSVSLRSDLAVVNDVCGDVSSLLDRHGQHAHMFAVDLLLRETITNAVIHGNQRNRQKRVAIDVCVGYKWIKMEVLDEGSGFNWRRASRQVPDEQATAGRGLAIMTHYASRVQFNRRGNKVVLWVRK